MVNEIVDGVSNKLRSAFGKGFDIHSEDIRQGFEEPCFFILVVSPMESPMLGNRYYRETLLDVHYFPEKGNAEMCAVGDRLFSVLEYVKIKGGPIRGTNMRYDIVNNVLHFFVTYKMFVTKPINPAPRMGGIKIEMEG